MNGKINSLSQVASIRRYTITEGSAKGLDFIDIDNGNIRFLLNVSKALDITQLYHKGVNISFLSKNSLTKRELAFGNRFEGGMLYTCGFDNFGGRDGYETHGTFHNTPAEIVRAECTDSEIVVEANIRNAELFGKNLLIRRKITTKVGSNKIDLCDELINESYRDEEYCVLYHFNVGYPMLDNGGKVIADVSEIKARNDWANENIKTALLIEDDVPNKQETCYFIKLNSPKITYVNEKLNKGLTLSYTMDTLPCFTLWKSMASGDYALGLEPCTSELDDNFERKIVKAGESVKFELSLCINEK